MTVYNKVWRGAYTLAFSLVAYFLLSSFVVFDIEFSHPWHFEVHVPEYIPEVDSDPLWGTDNGNTSERIEMEQATREIEPKQAND